MFVKLIYSYLCTVFSFHFSCATLFPLENTEAGRVFVSRVSWTKNITKAPSPHFIYFIICGLPGFKGIQGAGMFTQVHLSPEYHSEWSSLSPPLPSYHVNGLESWWCNYFIVVQFSLFPSSCQPYLTYNSRAGRSLFLLRMKRNFVFIPLIVFFANFTSSFHHLSKNVTKCPVTI